MGRQGSADSAADAARGLGCSRSDRRRGRRRGRLEWPAARAALVTWPPTGCAVSRPARPGGRAHSGGERPRVSCLEGHAHEKHRRIKCQRSEKVIFHIHAHLTVFVDGKARLVPYGIGIGPAAPPARTRRSEPLSPAAVAFSWLHTHVSERDHPHRVTAREGRTRSAISSTSGASRSTPAGSGRHADMSSPSSTARSTPGTPAGSRCSGTPGSSSMSAGRSSGPSRLRSRARSKASC